MSDVSVDSSTMTPVTSNAKEPQAATPTTKGAHVTFAPSPPRSSSIASNGDSLDATLSPEDLLSTLKEVRSDLAQARMDLSAEKAIRKRKEKNLVKLAKQLNTRTSTIEDQKKQIDSLVVSQTNLESRLETTRRELEQLTERHEKASRDHHAEIMDQQTKQRELSRDHDARIAELTAAHGKQSEELRRDVLKSQLDADRLRTQIASAEMQKNPSGADAVVDRTMRESIAAASSSSNGIGWLKPIVVSICAAFFIPILAYSVSSGDAICAPCSPGTNLADSTFIGEAPWWAPEPTKESMFNLLCGSSRTRTRIEWSGGNGSSMLAVINANSKEPRSKQDILLEKKALTATVGADKIRAKRANGKSEDITAPWLKA